MYLLIKRDDPTHILSSSAVPVLYSCSGVHLFQVTVAVLYIYYPRFLNDFITHVCNSLMHLETT